mmetsp:Transcript_36836/g.59584  ORF Transcript_36836/g.59584 Transcript_36836/m.59584 type:complete len:385 (+) Transcript_36836:134-1288(+)
MDTKFPRANGDAKRPPLPARVGSSRQGLKGSKIKNDKKGAPSKGFSSRRSSSDLPERPSSGFSLAGSNKIRSELLSALFAEENEFASILSAYEFMEKLGEGSFGTAWKVRRKTDGYVCVCKQIHISELAKSELDAIVNEVIVLHSLSSKYVIRYLHSFVDRSETNEDVFNIIMEYAPNGTLQQRIKERVHFDESTIWGYFLQMALGLHHIHSHRILHCDIKPSNVLIGENECLKISDCGCSKILHDAHRLGSNKATGTLMYMAPEMIAQKPYNEKSDIWSLGCTMYELCTLSHTFAASNKKALCDMIEKGFIRPISRSRYSTDLAWILTWILSKDPSSRPDTSELLSNPIVVAKAQDLSIELPIFPPLSHRRLLIPLPILPHAS